MGDENAFTIYTEVITAGVSISVKLWGSFHVRAMNTFQRSFRAANRMLVMMQSTHLIVGKYKLKYISYNYMRCKTYWEGLAYIEFP